MKKDNGSEIMYERVNENFRKMREFHFGNTEDIDSKISHLKAKYGKKSSSPQSVIKRLYTPAPQISKSTKLTEKYKFLFD